MQVLKLQNKASKCKVIAKRENKEEISDSHDKIYADKIFAGKKMLISDNR